MASRERPKSANPNRRLRTATHKVTDPRIVAQPETISDDLERLDIDREDYNQCPVSQISPSSSTDAVSEANRTTRRYSVATVRPAAAYDSLLTFECIQKASALRVLAKTLDRQRDVAATQTDPPASGNGETAEMAYRKTTPPPRKLRPIQRELSGSY